jgi:aminopeptidase N
MLREDWRENGLFFGAISGKTLGSFDVVYDPRAREQVMVGQLATRDNRRYFDTWTSFASRSVRNGRRKPAEDLLAVKNFAIDATIGTDLNLSATTTIDFTTKTKSDRVIVLDLSRHMKVKEVLLDGKPIEFFARESLRSNLIHSAENDSFLVVLPAPLDPGVTGRLQIAHEGQVIARSGNGIYYVGARTNWYPKHEAVFSTYDLTFRYPKKLQLVASGEVVEDRTDETTRVTRRRIDSPIRFAGFNLGDYEKASETRAGLTIEVYANRSLEPGLRPQQREVLPPPPPLGPGARGRIRPLESSLPITPLPPDPKARLRVLAAEVGAAMEFMTQNFGPPPLKTLTVSPIPGTFGQGFPGLLYLSTLAYLNPQDLPMAVRTDSQRRFFSDLLQAHEAAHQWWGNLVTSATYQDDWLMEALANYSALMFLEKRKGRKAFEEVLDEYREHLLTQTSEGKTLESAGPITLGTRLNSSQTASSWRAIVYEKGAWIIHMLRVRMGDAAFLKMLNALAQRNRYQRLSTDDFRTLAAEFVPKGTDDAKLEGFFEQWVYGTGIPSLKLTTANRGKAPKVRVQGTIAQSDVNEDFSIAVPVEIQLPGRRSMTKWVMTAGDAATFTADLALPPTKITIDPYAVLMRR